MKLTKIFAFALAALTMTACSDDDNKRTYNTNPGVTVSMGEATMKVKENAGLCYIPVVVEGEPNGYVTVTVKITEPATNAAVADKQFYVTSETININSEDKTANIEFAPVNFAEEQDPASFIVTIDKVEGATVGAHASCEVQIVDKGVAPYFSKIASAYEVSSKEYNFDEQDFTDDLKFNVTMTPVTVSEDGKSGTGVFSNYFGEAGFDVPFSYDYNDADKSATITLEYGALLMQANFGGSIGIADIMTCNTSGALTGGIKGQWNGDYDAIVFGTGVLGAGVFQKGSFLGFYTLISEINMKIAK